MRPRTARVLSRIASLGCSGPHLLWYASSTNAARPEKTRTAERALGRQRSTESQLGWDEEFDAIQVVRGSGGVFPAQLRRCKAHSCPGNSFSSWVKIAVSDFSRSATAWSGMANSR